ncbi:MAG: MBL fold metallo-hydrolase [Propionibacteriaceae bacterium]|nr:MBL fold metallo-hydrolase [Propionibacteriaceae bacterium]
MPEIHQLVTAGNFDLQGPPEHENNVWLIGDEDEVLVIDPAHDPQAVADAVAGRRVVAVVLTHGHWDHVRAVREFAALVGDPAVYLSPEDRFLWVDSHGDAPFEPLLEGKVFTVAGTTLEVTGTPGHTPGSMSLYCSDLHAVFTGDTLFQGGPGATRWDYSSFERIIASIQSQLFTLPDDTVVHTGHGPSTSIGEESPHLQEWVDRGW